ncbi:MAG TPA: C40 family peptidase [Chloroflexota bacterium]
MLVALLLDDGGRGLARLLGGVALVAVVVVLLLALLLVPLSLVVQRQAALQVGPRRPSPSLAPRQGAPNAPPVNEGSPTAMADPESPESSRAVAVARHYLGVPYVFGGTDPARGLDCSGLVQLVFRQLGVALPRTAQLQFNATSRVARDQLQPGDLVFFARTYNDPHDWITHVGIYIGGGLQINAPTEGQVVSIQPVFSGFWGAHFAAGGRFANAATPT